MRGVSICNLLRCRLLVNLTQPAYLCFNASLPKRKDFDAMRCYMEVEQHLRLYKEVRFIVCGSFHSMSSPLRSPSSSLPPPLLLPLSLPPPSLTHSTLSPSLSLPLSLPPLSLPPSLLLPLSLPPLSPPPSHSLPPPFPHRCSQQTLY